MRRLIPPTLSDYREANATTASEDTSLSEGTLTAQCCLGMARALQDTLSTLVSPAASLVRNLLRLSISLRGPEYGFTYLRSVTDAIIEGTARGKSAFGYGDVRLAGVERGLRISTRGSGARE